MRWAMFFGVVIAAALGLAAHARQAVEPPAAATAAPDKPPYLDFGSPLPALSIARWVQPPPDGKSLNQAIEGKPAVILLRQVATCDGPDGAWIPGFKTLAEAMKSDAVAFAWITTDSPENVEKVLAAHPLNAWVGLDGNRAIWPVMRTLGDSVVLLDSSGRIQAITRPDCVTVEVLRDLIEGRRLWLPSTYQVKVPWAETGGRIKEQTSEFAMIWPVLSSERDATWANAEGKWIYSGYPAPELILDAWWDSRDIIHHRERARIQNDAGVPETCFAAVVSLPHADGDALRTRLKSMIRDYFKVEPVMTQEVRKALILKSVRVFNPGEQSGRARQPSKVPGALAQMKMSREELFCVNARLSEVAKFLETVVFDDRVRVFDETNDSTEYDIRFNLPQGRAFSDIARCVTDQLGLVLVEAERPQPLLIIRKRAHDAAAPEAPVTPASGEQRQ